METLTDLKYGKQAMIGKWSFENERQSIEFKPDGIVLADNRQGSYLLYEQNEHLVMCSDLTDELWHIFFDRDHNHTLLVESGPGPLAGGFGDIFLIKKELFATG